MINFIVIEELKRVVGKPNTYYIDNILGNDSNNGLSELYAWKSLKNINGKNDFKSGSKILFKKGQIWYDQSLNFKSSGNDNEPIIISSYGQESQKPIISGISSLNNSIGSSQWKYIGNYIWRSTIEVGNPGRLFLKYQANSTKAVQELVKAYNINNLGKKTYSIKDKLTELEPDIWFWSSSKEEEQGRYKRLYVYNGSETINPSHNSGEDIIFKSTNTNHSYRHLNIVGCKNIIIDGIDFHGGVECVFIGESRHIKIQNCGIGKFSTHGIKLVNSDFINIDSNVLNTNYRALFGLSLNTITDQKFPNNLSGTDSRGLGDGINIVNDGSNCVISNNTFINWSHSAIFLLSKSQENRGIHSNKIYNNIISAPSISYSRAFAIAGIAKGVYKNEMYNNTVRHTTIQSQLAGSQNNFHHNIINDVSQSHVRLPGMANGIMIANNKKNYVADGNKFDYNTISNCDDAGININNWGSFENPRNPVKNNKFRNNIISNCGKQVNGKNDYIGLIIVDGSRGANPIVENNEYSGNKILCSDKDGNKIKDLILYHKQKYNTISFNNLLLRHNDIALDNSDELPSSIK